MMQGTTSRQGRGGGPKLTKTQREEVKARVAHLDRLGWNQYDIGREVGVSQAMVGQYLKRIREDYRKEQFGSKEEQLAKQMASLNWSKKEVSEAWERSKKDREKSIIEDSDGVKGAIHKERTETEDRLPASEYQRLYLEALAAERKLLGLEPETVKPGTEVNVNVGVQVNIWDALAGVAQAPEIEDTVERRLLETLEQPQAIEGAEREEAAGEGLTDEQLVQYGLKEFSKEAVETAASDMGDAADVDSGRTGSVEDTGEDDG